MARANDNTGFEDTELEIIDSELEDAESSPPEYEIATYPADFTLELLAQKFQIGEIIVPPFQRKLVWTMRQGGKLIESFLLGLPVPPIYLYSEKGTEKLLVVDGQQRLKTIHYFFEGFWGEEDGGTRSVFRLSSLNSKSRWYNKTFDEIQRTDEASSRKLNNAVLRSFIVKQIDPNDDTSIYHIFERLNTGGTTLKGQEIRNCIYRGALNELLVELNTNDNWRLIFGRQAPENRMRDVELILRFFALHQASATYDKPMKDFLSSYMSRNRNPAPDHLSQLRKMFEEVVTTVYSKLGAKPFHVRAGLNAAVFDSVFVALAATDRSPPPDLKQRYKKLIKGRRFESLTTSSTTDVDNVKGRISLAKRILLQ